MIHGPEGKRFFGLTPIQRQRIVAPETQATKNYFFFQKEK
jgi:hypothetical protein